MATKAERFKAESQRTRHESPKVKKPRRIIDPLHTDTRNVTKRADKISSVVLEDSTSGTPSRKSTRKGVLGGRNDQQLMLAQRGKTTSPKARALRAQVSRRK